MMHMPQWDLNISPGNTPNSLLHLSKCIWNFLCCNPRYPKIPKVRQKLISEVFPVNYSVGCTMISALPKDPTKLTGWSGCWGAPPGSTPPRTKAPILLHPELPAGSAQALVLTSLQGNIPAPNSASLFLFSCDRELPNWTHAWKSQSQHLCPREPENRHYGT